jgi:hypothetical protein
MVSAQVPTTLNSGCKQEDNHEKEKNRRKKKKLKLTALEDVPNHQVKKELRH